MRITSSRFAIAACFFSWLAFLVSSPVLAAEPKPPVLNATTADHTKFKELQKEFSSGPEVTKACLACHTEASKQIHKTQHWNWEFRNPDTDQRLGKKHVINNFCTSTASNLASCASCHIGYGLKDDKFDFKSEENVDCLACHDTTGKYKKPGGFAGNPVARDTEFPPGSGKIVRGINLSEISQKIGKTSRATCGSCHFYGGGGDGVKHGDLDSSLEFPDKALDVHMDAEGSNFTCATCHATVGHQVPGSRYAPTAQDRDGAHLRGKKDGSNPTTCVACHGLAPHKDRSARFNDNTAAKLNDHTGKVACQTCHVPYYARGDVPTKMSWDWSTAGQRGPDGKPLIKRDDEGHVIYNGIKGDFTMAENVKPDYIWFNGDVEYTLLGAIVEKKNEPIQINKFKGSATDGKSMIWPIKLFRGRQAYDPLTQSLVVTHLAGNDDSAYWTNLNWEKAVAVGMATVNAPFSGTVDFIDTESMWPITHMVAPKEKAVGCVECHSSSGRLEKVDGIYIPGRSSDHVNWLEIMGWTLAGLTLLGVLIHGLGRFIAFKRKS